MTSSHGPKNVFAVNARTGEVRWRYSPEVPAGIEQHACCDVNNRGVAHANGKIFVGRLDGHLVALDARTGKELWKSQVIDYTSGSVITSPPIVIKNLVVTGFGGGEYGVRGYITAFDQDTGREVWRLYTVPGAGEPGNVAFLWVLLRASSTRTASVARTPSCPSPARAFSGKWPSG